MLSLLLPLLLLLCNQLQVSVSTTSRIVVNENDVFSFDFTWKPLRPVANDTVHFKAVELGQSEIQRWGLSNASFRWYRQMPSADFRLMHVGRRYSRAADNYFEGRYRLSVKVNNQQHEPDTPSTSWSRVDIVKYIGLQRRVHSVLIVANRTDGQIGRRLVCRFWGYPSVESLSFSPPKLSTGCRTSSVHFETAEAEPYIDLVSDCSDSRLPTGQYSCYGRNSIGESRLKCQLTEDRIDILGEMSHCQEFAAEEVNIAASRKGFQQFADNSRGILLESVAIATITSCLATAICVSMNL